jgi:KUP system potassium uptake protein
LDRIASSRGQATVHTRGSGRIALGVAALGVVYGDIGTSPLYALNILFSHYRGHPVAAGAVYGGLSLVVWALTIVVTVKYAIFVLRADNDGEGGVFALYGLLDKFNRNGKALLAWSLLLGAGLLFGDGVITPAISVLSAVEGISIATPVLSKAVIPITIVLLTLLFSFQYKGTRGVGRIFGPIMVVWFVVIAIFGVLQIIRQPQILNALNPLYALAFLADGNLYAGLMAMGAVMLVVTGGEAMYADMGHFGAGPIRFGWFGLVYPALVLNYLGQGAYLLSSAAHAGDNLFFSLAPKALLYPVVALATAATVIASQALISGTFSLTAQAVALGFFPQVRIAHTQRTQAGEVYAPFINWSLYIGCVALVIAFGSSDALGAAYGLAVSGVMVTTSTAMYLVALHYWNWGRLRAGLVFGALALIDLSFLVSNSLKFFEGGYVPLSIGLTIFLVMLTWNWGRRITVAAYRTKRSMTMAELIDIHRASTQFIDRTAILMVPARALAQGEGERTPTLLQLLWTRQGLLPRNIIFFEVVHAKVPYVRDNRFAVTMFEQSAKGVIVHVELSFGFMEFPDVERALKDPALHKQIHLATNLQGWIVHVANEHLNRSEPMGRLARVRLKLFELLRFISQPTYYHYGLGVDLQLAVEVLPVRVT